jgi:RNA polymerase sigma-70 factor, ECF subfamily
VTNPISEAEFEAFHARTSRPLWAYLRRISGDPALADDVLQESYLRLLRHPPSADRDEREHKAYLFQIATNLMRDRWRAKERERSALERLLSFWSPRPERSEGLSSDMGAALDRLAPRDRALLWLAHVEGYDHREIAKVLGLQERSVRVILFRARKKLERELV